MGNPCSGESNLKTREGQAIHTLSVVILNWNTADLLEACLSSLEQNVTCDHEVIVVDNCSDDDSVPRVRDRFPNARLLPQSENLGFSRGNEIGLAVADGRFLLLLNPDTEVLAGAVEDLVEYMESHPDVGIAGPTLWNPDGTHQPSTAPLPSLGIELLRQTMLWKVIPTLTQRKARRNEEYFPGQVTGAALCIRRECYEQIGPLDREMFMFYEDTDWCRRARAAGWRVAFRPGPGIVHVGGAASKRFARTRTLLSSQRSTIHYFKKHHGGGSIPALRFITGVGASIRLLRAVVELALNRDRNDRRERIRAYARMIRWAFGGREF